MLDLCVTLASALNLRLRPSYSKVLEKYRNMKPMLIGSSRYRFCFSEGISVYSCPMGSGERTGDAFLNLVPKSVFDSLWRITSMPGMLSHTHAHSIPNPARGIAYLFPVEELAAYSRRRPTSTAWSVARVRWRLFWPAR